MATVTRFAPSPTGPLHLGGARTALFNFLHAKVKNGKFKLRIEDTDQNRNSKEFTNLIIKSLEWLGLRVDDEVVYQSKRKNHHIEIANSLVSKGLAYKCFHEKEYLEQYKFNKKKFVSEWRDKSSIIPNKSFSIRIKSPLSGNYVLDDTIQGKVKVDLNEIDDYIIVRSDGTPTFLLSSAVDDYDMNVTDIIRGDDHLTNSFRQKIIFDFLNYKPSFTHMSLIHNQFNQKLSKRDNATSVLEYKKRGYLPEALINYLIRLGWSYGDEEFFTIKDVKTKFKIENLGKSPSKFDESKLNFLNNFYIKKTKSIDILNYFKENFDLEPKLNSFKEEDLHELISVFKDRASSLNEIFINMDQLCEEKKNFNEEEKIIIEDFENYKGSLVSKFSDIIDWNEQNIEKCIKETIQKCQTSFKQVGKPLRLLLTGRLLGPSIFKLIKILGKNETIKRLTNKEK